MQQMRETVSLRVAKLLENSRGKLALVALECDGALEFPKPVDGVKRIEVVGDSITCGYGNEASNTLEHFEAKTENGWETFGAIAARQLGADVTCVCVSGISICRGKYPDEMRQKFPCMEELYGYTDGMTCKQFGWELEPWNPSRLPVDAIVINLGTNDSAQITMAQTQENCAQEERFWEERYFAFLQQVRRINGPNPWIVCTLGTINYYLYDDILRVAEQYRRETGDQKICCYKYKHPLLGVEGLGADGHPSKVTHIRMGKELAEFLIPLLW